MNLEKKRIKVVVNIIAWFYLLVPLLLPVFIVLSLWLHRSIPFQIYLSGIIGVVIYLGLKGIKAWVVSVIVYLSGFSLLSQLLYRPENLMILIAKLFGISFLVFQLYFFTRQKVKKYFKVKSLFLFG